eukprot:4607479-Prymnesium_polylepis.1
MTSRSSSSDTAGGDATGSARHSPPCPNLPTPPGRHPKTDHVGKFCPTGVHGTPRAQPAANPAEHRTIVLLAYFLMKPSGGATPFL